MALKNGVWLGPLDAAEFLERYWQKRPLLIRNALGKFTCPVDPTALFKLARSTQVESRVVTQKGVPPFLLRRGPFSEGYFRKLPKTHWTLLVQDVDKHLQQVADLVEQFTFVPRWRIDDIMVSYAVKGGSVGPHYDNYDVFLLQGKGRRRWQIGPRPKHPRLLPDTELQVLQNFTANQDMILEPGDMLYLPPSIAHHGVAVDESITLSIGFRAPSQRELCFALVEELLTKTSETKRYADPGLHLQRHSGLLDHAAVSQVQHLLSDGLRVESSEIERWLGRFVTEPKPHLVITRRGTRLTTAQLLQASQKGSRVKRSLGSRWAFFCSKKKQSHLYVDGQEWILSARLLPLVQCLCDSPVTKLSELPCALTDKGGLKLLNELFALGLLQLDNSAKILRTSKH